MGMTTFTRNSHTRTDTSSSAGPFQLVTLGAHILTPLIQPGLQTRGDLFVSPLNGLQPIFRVLPVMVNPDLSEEIYYLETTSP